MQMQKLKSNTMKRWRGLPKNLRAKAKALIARHIKACLKAGVSVESWDELIFDTVEMVRAEHDEAQRGHDTGEDWFAPVASTAEPFRKYDTYTAPKEV